MFVAMSPGKEPCQSDCNNAVSTHEKHTMIKTFSVLALAAAGSAALLAAPATAATPETEPEVLQATLGVQMTIKNDTSEPIRVDPRDGGSWKRLFPGQTATFSGKHSDLSDELELDVSRLTASFSDRERILELDGSNPKWFTPSMSITHVPTGGNTTKRFSVWENTEMFWGRAWVQRTPDSGDYKEFTVHIKRLS